MGTLAFSCITTGNDGKSVFNVILLTVFCCSEHWIIVANGVHKIRNGISYSGCCITSITQEV